ncbi:MAG: hypothetical protein MJ237_04490 [bacterium]|nr:hypothetical protein [bacterium]
MKKHSELMNYQRYAGRLGGSNCFGLSQIAGLAPNLIGRASMFGQYMDMASSVSAMQNLQQMKAMGRVPYTGNQYTQMQIEMSAFNKFKEQAMQSLKMQEVQMMNRKEQEIQLELNSLQQELTVKKNNLKACKELLKEQTEENAMKFGL